MTAIIDDAVDEYVPPPSALQAKQHAASNRAVKIGAVAVLAAIFIALLIWQRTNLGTVLGGGRSITAEFVTSYKLQPQDSTVKLAGLEVGTVTGISYTNHGTALIRMKINDNAMNALGSNPTASIEPRTVLGGRYVVELHHGGTGKFQGFIPVTQTTTPVELDRVLEALPASTRKALQSLVGELGPTLTKSKQSLNDLARMAPGVLNPGATVVQAAEGTNPQADLSNLVANLNSVASTLTQRDGQLASIARDLNATAATLDAHRAPLSAAVANLPETLAAAQSGISGLDGSIQRLQTAAGDLMPSVPNLNSLITKVRPVLAQAVPLLHDLQPLLAAARPTVQTLVPVASQATNVLTNLHGPVLDRLNGPISSFILNPWVGKGPYAGGTDNYMRDTPLYKELGYLTANIDRASAMQDHYGSTFAFQVGAAANSIDGLPFDLDSLVQLGLKSVLGINSPAQQTAILKKAGLK